MIMTTRRERHEARMERMDRHVRVMREFMIAEFHDDIADAQEELARAIASGNELDRKRLESRLAELTEKLRSEEAQLRAA
jgi:hypothetical protein